MADPVAAPPGYVDNGDGTFTDPMTGEVVDGDGTQIRPPTDSVQKLPPVDVTGQRDPPDGGSVPNPPATTPGGFDLGSFIQKLVSDPSMLQNLLSQGGLLAAGLKSSKALNDAADSYTTMGEKYAGQLDPYGSYRKAAADKLAALQADPSSIKDTPGYKFTLDQNLGAIANRDNRQFGVGAGSTNPDLMNYASGLASKTYNDTIKQLQDQAGVGIGPGAAASILNTGMQGNIQAKLGAVNAQNNLISAFTQPGGGTRNGSGAPTGTGAPGNGSPVSNWVQNIINSLKPGAGTAPIVPGNSSGGDPTVPSGGTDQPSFNNTPDNEFIPVGGGA